MYLEIEQLTKHFGDVVAVDNISLSVDKGNFVTLLGPSGSGKTTILRMIAGFATPSGGHIRIDGEPVEDTPPHKRNLGMVFQDYSLFPHLSVYQNVVFGLRMRGLLREEQQQRVAEALATVQLSGYEDRRPDQLSGGQQQRVALARAIVIEPLVLLLDEPLGALDRKLREEMQIELRRIHDELRVTTIFVTHDQDEALSLSDRVAILNSGHLDQFGTPFEVYENPATPFVADFLGRANLLWLSVVESSTDGIKANLSEHTTLTIPPDENIQTGDKIRIVVRPERIKLGANRASDTDNSVTCTVERVVYLGSGAYVILNAPGDNQLTVHVPARQLAESQAVSEGDEVSLSWPSEACIIVDHTRA